MCSLALEVGLRCGRTGNETLEERLAAQVLVVLLEVLLGGSDELDGDKLVTVVPSAMHSGVVCVALEVLPSLLEAADDVADDATLSPIVNIQALAVSMVRRGARRTWTPSGLTAMKLFPTTSVQVSRQQAVFSSAHSRLLGGRHVVLFFLFFGGFDVLSEAGAVFGAKVLENGRFWIQRCAHYVVNLFWWGEGLVRRRGPMS